jgi:hypothetical protein
VRGHWDRLLGVVLALVGVASLVIGWYGVSGTGLVAEQNPYLISAGLGGVALLVLGCTLWISADMHDEWRRLDALSELLDERLPHAAALDAEPVATTDQPAPARSRVPRTRPSRVEAAS